MAKPILFIKVSSETITHPDWTRYRDEVVQNIKGYTDNEYHIIFCDTDLDIKIIGNDRI